MLKTSAGIRRRFRPAFIVWLTIMWCLLMGEFTVANLVGGAAVGFAVVFLLPLPKMPVDGIRISIIPLLGFLVRWFAELLLASIRVGWLALRPQELPRAAIVRAPMRVDNELVLSFAVSMYNLQPGGAVTDIDIANRMLTIHLLVAPDEEAIARELAAVARLERTLITIFERTR